MQGRFISAVARYGPKTGPVRDFLADLQAVITAHVGDRFRPYSLDQIHATLVALNGVRDPATGVVVNEYYRTNTGTSREMDLKRALETVASHFAEPLRIRFGGYHQQQEVPFTSRGQHLFHRAFSAQGNAFVLVGWPVVSLTGGRDARRPLDELRRDVNAANVLHRYHVRDTDVDNDLHLVLGHYDGAAAGGAAAGGAAAGGAERAVDAVREKLAADPFEIAIGRDDVKIVAADSPTLAPALYVSGLPADEAIVRGLMS